MGLGKTTLCKSIIHGFGYAGVVTSPTYNLIQEYSVSSGTIYHMDLYRLQDPAELEYLALADLWTDQSLFLVEWPEHGAGFLPAATAQIAIDTVTKQVSHRRQICFSKFVDEWNVLEAQLSVFARVTIVYTNKLPVDVNWHYVN